MRTFVVLVSAAAFLAAVPVANAQPEPHCLEVYPWSELCRGDVVGFVNGMGILACDVEECVTLTTTAGGPAVPVPQPDCIQVIPWSYLCSGNVEAFVEYYTGPLGEVLA